MKAAALITARLKSERLPGKALVPLLGRPLLSHLVERLRQCQTVDAIVLCTSTLSDDDALVEWAGLEKIAVHRGDPTDVIARLAAASVETGADTVVSVTGDNPLVDPEHSDRLVRLHEEGRYDYSRWSGLPLGSFGYVLSGDALRRLAGEKKTSDTEIWGPLFEPGRFKLGVFPLPDARFYWPDLRLTVDTPQDLQLVRHLLSELHRPGNTVSLKEVLDYCKKFPEVPRINGHIAQRSRA